MSRDVVVSELIKGQSKSLKMPGLARVFEALGRQAREEKWSPEDYLHEVLSAEQTSRADSAVRQRLHDARFPEMKPLDSFDFAEAEGIDAKEVAALARCEWVTDAKNVLLVGPIGTGKTHLAIALGIEVELPRFRRVPMPWQKDETMPKTNPDYPAEFKKRVVELARAGRTPASLAREFGMTQKSVRNWRKQADIDEGRSGDGLTTDERAELSALRRKVKVLEEEREILSKAATWFAQKAASTPKGRSNS